MIYGQDLAVARFTEALGSGALHHAWLIGGPRGVGKAHFARLAATRLLADATGPRLTADGIETPVDHPIARLMAAGSHPDFRRLERELNDKGDALRRNISIGQVRKLGEFLANTTSMSPWRAVVIDAADDLEAEGANALLKMLEEPPANSLFLIVAHAPGRLLPTIRSRCRRLDFQPLSDRDMAAVLRAERPELKDAELAQLLSAGEGSIGKALAFATLDLAPLEREAVGLMRDGDPSNVRRSKLAQSLAGKAAAERYGAFVDAVPGFIAREARTLAGDRQRRALDAYARSRETAVLAKRLTFDPAATIFQLGTILASIA